MSGRTNHHTFENAFFGGAGDGRSFSLTVYDVRAHTFKVDLIETTRGRRVLTEGWTVSRADYPPNYGRAPWSGVTDRFETPWWDQFVEFVNEIPGVRLRGPAVRKPSRAEKGPHATVHCPECDEPRSIAARGEWRCPECQTGFCPFCHATVGDECKHLLASGSDDGGWNRSPFGALPHLPARFEETTVLKRHLRAAFGPLAPAVAEAWEAGDGGYCAPPDSGEQILFAELADRLKVPIEVSSWEIHGSGGRDYFTPEPKKARAAIRQMVGQLRAGFQRLATGLRAERRS